MYIKSMDAVWRQNYGYTGQYRDKMRDVIKDFNLDVEVIPLLLLMLVDVVDVPDDDRDDDEIANC